MGRVLLRRLKQTKPLSPVQEAAVNLLLAGSWLNDRLERALEDEGLTLSQYNVLRILRGAQPEGLPRGDIACRLIDRAPDVTRLVDRLEARQLVERARDPKDARRSVSRITRTGLALLTKGNDAMQAVHEALGQRLSAADVQAVSRICEALYGPDI